MGLITESDCISVTDLNQTVRYICFLVDVGSKMHKFFMTIVSLTCLFN